MSRATVDLQSVRFFLGYGLVFIAQSVVTILLAAVAMFILQPDLAAISLAPVPFVILIANRYGHRSRPAMQEAQQRIAELTADAEENVSGVRVVKAFAQEERQLERFRHTVQRVFDQQMVGHAHPGVLQPAAQLPAQPRARRDPAVRRPPGDRRLAHAGRVHRLLRLPAHAHLPDADARVHARRLAALDGLGRAHLPGARPRAADRVRARTPRRCPTAAARCRCAASGSPSRARPHPALSDIDLDVPAGQMVALVGAMGSGKSALVSLLPAPVRRQHRLGGDRRRRRALGGGAQPAPGDRRRQRRPLPVQRHDPRQHRLRPRRRHPRGGAARRRRRPGRRVHRAPARRL